MRLSLSYTGKLTTELGELETRLLFKWQKTKGDNATYGSLRIEDAYAALACWKVGYTDTLMNF